MNIYTLIEDLYGYYQNDVSISQQSLINTLQYYNIPFTYNVHTFTQDMRITTECLTFKTTESYVVDINIELYEEGSRIIITMVNDYITDIRRESSYSNIFMNCNHIDPSIIENLRI